MIDLLEAEMAIEGIRVSKAGNQAKLDSSLDLGINKAVEGMEELHMENVSLRKMLKVQEGFIRDLLNSKKQTLSNASSWGQGIGVENWKSASKATVWETKTAAPLRGARKELQVEKGAKETNGKNNPWIQLFKENRVKENGIQLEFVQPRCQEGNRKAQIEKPDVVTELARWENSGWVCSCMEKEDLTHVPIWIRLPHLKLHMWSGMSPSKIACIIGTPLFIDKLTAERGCFHYARLCVEVEMGKELPDQVMIED
ncbi:hypothetical protein F0562_003451 [Nyssa sinensis]|uniref:Uncharacterized protein n=1 Tax=Nyssa sinensis TaxID=561372 RepID=A0A5J5BZF4_9ASTE|nr:hypothetical protein F0562_003451 [Nyssa sinensis]